MKKWVRNWTLDEQPGLFLVKKNLLDLQTLSVTKFCQSMVHKSYHSQSVAFLLAKIVSWYSFLFGRFIFYMTCFLLLISFLRLLLLFCRGYALDTLLIKYKVGKHILPFNDPNGCLLCYLVQSLDLDLDLDLYRNINKMTWNLSDSNQRCHELNDVEEWPNGFWLVESI